MSTQTMAERFCADFDALAADLTQQWDAAPLGQKGATASALREKLHADYGLVRGEVNFGLFAFTDGTAAAMVARKWCAFPNRESATAARGR